MAAKDKFFGFFRFLEDDSYILYVFYNTFGKATDEKWFIWPGINNKKQRSKIMLFFHAMTYRNDLIRAAWVSEKEYHEFLEKSRK